MHNVLNSYVWPAIPVVVVLFCEPASAKTRDLLCSNCKCYSVSCFSSFADKSTEEYNSSNTLVSFYFLYSDIGRYGGKHAETQHYSGTARARGTLHGHSPMLALRISVHATQEIDLISRILFTVNREKRCHRGLTKETAVKPQLCC